MYASTSLAGFRVREVEVDFPGAAIFRFLPLAGDRLAVGADLADETLIESGRVSPRPPFPVCDPHLIDAVNPARIEVEGSAVLALIVAADDLEAPRKALVFHLRVDAQELAVLGGPHRGPAAALRVLLARCSPVADQD